MKYCCTNNERQGSCYFELQKGRQLKWIFWKDDSLYLHADIVDELQVGQLLQQAIPHFAYYGPTIVTWENWQEVKRISAERDSKTQDVMNEIDEWVKECFFLEDCFSIFGI